MKVIHKTLFANNVNLMKLVALLIKMKLVADAILKKFNIYAMPLINSSQYVENAQMRIKIVNLMVKAALLALFEETLDLIL